MGDQAQEEDPVKLGDRPPEEHDELAKDLPGLPVVLDGLAVDETGLRFVAQGRTDEVHIAWRNLTRLGTAPAQYPRDRWCLSFAGQASTEDRPDVFFRTRGMRVLPIACPGQGVIL